MIAIHPVGALIALAVFVSITATLYWMLHPPTTVADRMAKAAEAEVAELIGSVVIVFSPDIHSEPLMALAVRLASRAKAKLLALYVIEVPLTLPPDADMESEQREALGVLATAETIARKRDVECATEVVKARNLAKGVLDVAKRTDAHLILLGAYREGKYTGAPLGRAIETIAANAKCDVLIGVPGTGEGSLLSTPPPDVKKPIQI